MVKQACIQAVQKFQHRGKTRLQFGKAQFLVVQRRHCHTGQARRNAFGKVACHLDLAQHGKHVGEKPGLQQRIGVNVFRSSVGFSLGQHAAEGAQHLFENGNRGCVDSAGHGFFLGGLSTDKQKAVIGQLQTLGILAGIAPAPDQQASISMFCGKPAHDKVSSSPGSSRRGRKSASIHRLWVLPQSARP